MTDLEQRVAAALAEARYGDKIKPGMSPFRGRWLSKAHAQVAPFLAALAAQGLAITEAPDAEGAELPPVNPDLIAVGSWGHYRPLKEADPAEYARLDALRRAAPPSSVDGEGLRAAASEVIAERNREGYFAARSVEFWHAVDRLESALAASGSASGAAKEGPE